MKEKPNYLRGVKVTKEQRANYIRVSRSKHKKLIEWVVDVLDNEVRDADDFWNNIKESK